MPVPSAEGVHRRELLRDNVYTSLRDAIVDGTLAPGERLRDAELEAWLGVSRTPIREALMRLERAGLVLTRPGRYTAVSAIDGDATRNAQQIAASLHELATRLAVPLLSDDDVERMREANDRFAEALEHNDPDAALYADDQFHGVVVAASSNPMIAEMIEQVSPLLRRVERRRFGSFGGRASVSQHTTIIGCCAAGDVEGAAAAVRANWQTLAE